MAAPSVVLPTAPMRAQPALAALVEAIRPRKGALDFSVTTCETGLDVMVSGFPARDVDRLRLTLIDIANRFDLARLSAAGEPPRRARTPPIHGAGGGCEGLRGLPGRKLEEFGLQH